MVGGGIVGLAAARALLNRRDVSLAVVEAEPGIARHQTGHNSGVIHSGLYYRPGSLKAVNCTRGREQMYRFCGERGIPHERCGKLVVALTEAEVGILRSLHQRGEQNGLTGLTWLSAEAIREFEPNVAGLAGLRVPQTGIVDFAEVCRVYAADIQEKQGEILTGFRLRKVEHAPDGFHLSSDNQTLHARQIINCAGLQSDRVARLCGMEPGVQIIPFRGEYYKLREDRKHLVRDLIYPVPDPRFPFLGVHFTRMMDGAVEAGPNAVLALCREGYRWRDVSPGDLAEMVGYRGFWNMAGKYWKTGMGEMHRSLSKTAFTKALQRLLPALDATDLTPAGAGVRAQAVAPDGSLVDDFRIVRDQSMIHVLNAPSPAATSSLSIGESIADLAAETFGWPS